MALTREQSQIWQAMNVGVQWVLRDGIDPLAPEPKPAASAAPAEVKPSAGSPSATIPAGSAPAASAMVRRGPMATRLRRQQAAAGIQSAPAATTANPATSAAVAQTLKPAAAASIATRPALRPVAPPRPQSAAASQVQADAQLVAENIALQLENRISFRRAMKSTMQRTMKAGAKGIKTSVSGRLGGADMARTEFYSEGTIPLQTLRADIDYGFAEADTTYGKVGVKAWIYNGEILPTKGTKEGSDK